MVGPASLPAIFKGGPAALPLNAYVLGATAGLSISALACRRVLSQWMQRSFQDGTLGCVGSYFICPKDLQVLAVKAATDPTVSTWSALVGAQLQGDGMLKALV